MTLRVLLKKLHGVAAQLGADTEVAVQGLYTPVFLVDVVSGRAKRKNVAVLHLTKDSVPRVRPASRRADMRENYRYLVGQGLCYRCKTPVGDSGTRECIPCRDKKRQRERERKR